MEMSEFRVNDTLTLKLEGKDTSIYVNGEFFRQCTYLLLNVPVDNVSSFDNISSIDEAEERLDHSLDPLVDPHGNIFRIDKIPPEVEFWGHCSNLQVWAEHKYDSRLLHRNLAFPLLKKLADVGDIVARKVLKDEIAKRIESGFPPVVEFLVLEEYLEYLNDEEFDAIAKNPKVIEVLIKAGYKDEEDEYRFDGLYKFLEILKKRNTPYLKELIGNFFQGSNFKLHYFLDTSNLICELSNKELAYILLPQEEAEVVLKMESFMPKGLIFTVNPKFQGEPVFVENNHIIKLNLSYRKLDIFPKEILKLKYLKELWLNGNLIPEIPNAVHKLKELEILSLGNNYLEFIPNSLCKLKKLKVLILSNNKLKSIPDCLRNIKTLNKLDISNNVLKI